jgi:hypothetical protein
MPGPKASVSIDKIIEIVKQQREKFVNDSQHLILPCLSSGIYDTISSQFQGQISPKAVYLLIKQHIDEVEESLGAM